MLKPKGRLRLGKQHAILLVIALCFAAGLVAGALSVHGMGEVRFAKAASDMATYLHTMGASPLSKAELFRASVFKHVKLVVIIWFLAFAPAGGFAVFVLLLLRGASYGFTTALLVDSYGATGLVTSAILYMPQCLVLVPAYFFMSYCTVNYILVNLKRKNDKRPQPKTQNGLKSHAASLAVGCGAAVLAGAIDTFVVPMLVKTMM